jgi:hypothetical protein
VQAKAILFCRNDVQAIDFLPLTFISTDQVPVVFNHKKYITFCPFWYFVV